MAVRLTGKIKTLVADRREVIIELDNDPSNGPLGNIWHLDREHGNFNAIYSLALAAAANRWPITIRISSDVEIDSSVEAGIKSLGVAW